MHHDCNECTRLWSEYALATRHYLKVEGKLQIADTSRDERTMQELRPLLEQASAERSELRRQIEEHEAMPHGNTASAASA